MGEDMQFLYDLIRRAVDNGEGLTLTEDEAYQLGVYMARQGYFEHDTALGQLMRDIMTGLNALGEAIGEEDK